MKLLVVDELHYYSGLMGRCVNCPDRIYLREANVLMLTRLALLSVMLQWSCVDSVEFAQLLVVRTLSLTFPRMLMTSLT
jgi:hypothetical protein